MSSVIEQVHMILHVELEHNQVHMQNPQSCHLAASLSLLAKCLQSCGACHHTRLPS